MRFCKKEKKGKKKKKSKLEKKRSQLAQIFSPGRWTGNKLSFRVAYFQVSPCFLVLRLSSELFEYLHELVAPHHLCQVVQQVLQHLAALEEPLHVEAVARYSVIGDAVLVVVVGADLLRPGGRPDLNLLLGPDGALLLLQLPLV